MVKILGEYDLVGAPKRRVKGPKARTGCLSCKIRHVKCDERKPECLRCEKFGCKCEGYATAPPKIKPKATSQVVLPRISAQFQPIFYQPSDNKFQNNEENRYFKLFCDGMAPHLAGHVTCDFWTRIVLQACDSDASIRYAVIALAALKSTSETKASSHAWTDEEQLKANSHHQFAIKSYSKAVRHMRNAALGGDNDLRSTLINCMVLVCFESFHGDHRSAAKQIGIGLSLIEDHLINRKPSHTDPVIENELLAAFGQLEIQALTFGESRSRESHLRLADIGEDRVKSMPITFADFSEALIFFEVIQQRLFHFMAGVLVVTCRGCLTLDNALSLDVKDLPKRDRYLGDYSKWHNAFETLLKQARQSGDRDFLFFASSMQLLYLTGYVAAVMVRDSDHEYPETRKLMPMFAQMLALSKSVMKYSPEDPGKSNFKIGMQIICPLYSVARRCPHRATRKEAISILLSHHRREGLWDSMLAGKFAEWIMELEDENYQGDYIPENLRCTGMTLISCNMVLRRAHVRGLVPNRDGSELIPREKIITW